MVKKELCFLMSRERLYDGNDGCSEFIGNGGHAGLLGQRLQKDKSPIETRAGEVKVSVGV